MHELGVVFHAIETIEKLAAENNVTHVNSVTVQLGEVSTVIPSLMEDCWNWAVGKHEVMTGCLLIIEQIPAITHCADCGTDYPTVTYAKICPNCGSENTYLLQGNEFIIKDMEVS